LLRYHFPDESDIMQSSLAAGGNTCIAGGFGVKSLNFTNERKVHLIDLIMTSNVDEEDLVFPNKLKHDSTVVVNAESPSAFEFPTQFMGSQLWRKGACEKQIHSPPKSPPPFLILFDSLPVTSLEGFIPDGANHYPDPP
jgi:hypothetical protein